MSTWKREKENTICRIFPNVNLFKNQEANYLLHRQVTKAEKKNVGVLEVWLFSQGSDYMHHIRFTYMLIRGFIFIEELASFV